MSLGNITKGLLSFFFKTLYALTSRKYNNYRILLLIRHSPKILKEEIGKKVFTLPFIALPTIANVSHWIAYFSMKTSLITVYNNFITDREVSHLR